MGVNTVDTYVAWNIHEPTPGAFRFVPNTFTDIEGFLRTANSVGLMVLLRAGPYICAGEIVSIPIGTADLIDVWVRQCKAHLALCALHAWLHPVADTV